MGAKQSSDKLSLAEKRYRINSPKKTCRRSHQRYSSLKLPETTSMSFELPSSVDENRAVALSSSMNKVTGAREFLSQSSVDSSTSAHTPIAVPTISPFFTDQQVIMKKYQRQLVVNSWKQSRKSGVDNIGSRVFLLVLIAEPDIKMIFGLDKIPQGRLKYDPRFRKHTGLISKSFDFAVKNLVYTEKLAQHFHGLGKRHVSMQGRGFKPRYWEIFAECMFQTTTEWLSTGQNCEQAIKAWHILIAFIIKHMRIGFEKEKLMRKKYTLPSLTTAAPSTIASSTAFPGSNQKMPKAQLSNTNSQAIIDDACLLSASSCCSNQKSSSFFTESAFSDDFNQLRLTALRHCAKTYTSSGHSTVPERERPESPASDYFTPPSTRRTLTTEMPLEKKLFSSQNLTRSQFINA